MSEGKQPPDLRWPEIEPEALQEIGRTVIAWGVMEREVGSVIEDLLTLDPAIGMAVNINLSISGKLNLVHSLYELQKGAFLRPVDDNLKKLSARTHKAATEYRDFFAHGQPYPLKMEERDVWAWAKINAKKGGVKGHMRLLRKGDITPMADEVSELAKDWHSFRGSIQNAVTALRWSNREAWEADE